VTNLITPRALFSPIFLQSCFLLFASIRGELKIVTGSDDTFQR